MSDAARPLAGHTVLGVFAHPDDEALACGGTLARLADGGARVVVACATRGELGSSAEPALLGGRALADVRAQELAASARVLGAAEVELLDLADGCLRWSPELEARIAALLERHRPVAVITFDADGLYWHPDHIGVHEHTTAAVRALGSAAPALYYVSMPVGAMRSLVDAARARGGAPDGRGLWGISPDAFGVEAPAPALRIDVGPWTERKLAAIRCHRTQLPAGSPFTSIDPAEARRWLGIELFRRGAGGLPTLNLLETLGERMAG